MRTKAALLGVALLVLAAGTASAGQTWMGMTGGVGVPTGDYGDVATTGWQLGITGTHMIDDQWGIGADLGYHAWNASDDVNTAAETLYGPGSEIKWSAFQGTMHGELNFPTQGSMKPYCRAGLGIYNVATKLSSPSGDADDSQSKLGFNFGAGMNFLTQSNMRWGIMGAYHIVPTKNDLGSDVNFFEIGANVMWGLNR